MKRKIIHIDEVKCNGCGICAEACHEGAIGIVEGKAKLLRDDYCDGMGDCLPACPQGAITFTEREADAYNKEAADEAKKAKEAGKAERNIVTENQKEAEEKGRMEEHKNSNNEFQEFQGCPGHQIKQFVRDGRSQEYQAVASCGKESTAAGEVNPSELMQWPVEIKLVPVNAPYFSGAKLLIAADCTAYAYASFHRDFMKGRITVVGCPKLDSVDYSEKLTDIIRENDIKSVTVVRMEVPCCGGLEHAAITALKNSGKFIPWQVVTISTDGRILNS